MDILTRRLLDDRQVLVDALTALQAGHAESVGFVTQYTNPTQTLTMPTSLAEALKLAEWVADLALNSLTLDTYSGPLLRSMLLLYGHHLSDCPQRKRKTAACLCSWENIHTRLVKTAEVSVEGKVIP